MSTCAKMMMMMMMLIGDYKSNAGHHTSTVGTVD
jgi:hypothetical protein